MAMRSKKHDVQKASYYVFFLGAQEARELRGDRILLSSIPRIIERSRNHQEPMKVTLSISQKGLKIIQGPSKHFIPQNAITCSIVSDDIVACILLLYNPETRCPLHVHAYRCDSNTTAKVLNDQLQILIMKPDNQKRFAELEMKLEKSLQMIERSKPPPMLTSRNNFECARPIDVSQKRFDSSLGSDTGTSTECSEEQIDRSSHLYDSLAAELKAKLKGSGAPLLLPPRDYDTISRSQGNLTAVEFRRCQNMSIVGREMKSKRLLSSLGSSGISSDLAPSPERHDETSNSSGEDWKNGYQRVPEEFIRKMEEVHISKQSLTRFRENPPTHIFPKEPSSYEKSYSNQEQPIIARKQMQESRMHYGNSKDVKNDRKQGDPVSRKQSGNYRSSMDYSSNEKSNAHEFVKLDKYDRENLTDKQKFREIVEGRKHKQDYELPRSRDYKNDIRTYSPEKMGFSSQHLPKSSERSYHHEDLHYGKQHMGDGSPRNPYLEPESLPYRQSIESMMKSPVMKYRSQENRQRYRSPSSSFHKKTRAEQVSGRKDYPSESYARRDERDINCGPSPMSTMKRTTPRDRFEEAKEKFKSIEKMRVMEARVIEAKRSEMTHYKREKSHSPEPMSYPVKPEWSSEEELSYSQERDEKKRHLAPAKSLGNLVRGYRHSYAEPPLRFRGRVGLAAIDPY